MMNNLKHFLLPYHIFDNCTDDLPFFCSKTQQCFPHKFHSFYCKLYYIIIQIPL